MFKITFYIGFIFLPFTLFAEIRSFAVLGDAGEWNKSAKLTFESVKNSGIKNLILPGDNIYSKKKKYSDIWDVWGKNDFNFSVVALGNHKLSYKKEIKYFKLPGEYYEKVFGRTRFLVLNSDNKKNVKEQVKWFKQRLKENEKYIFNFVVFHHPPATLSFRHRWRKKRKFQNKIRPLLLKYKKTINGIIVGHEHIASLVSFDELPVIVSGATKDFEKTRYRNYKLKGVRVKTRWLNMRGNYWVKLILNEFNNDVLIYFIRSDLPEVPCFINLNKKYSPDTWYCS